MRVLPVVILDSDNANFFVLSELFSTLNTESVTGQTILLEFAFYQVSVPLPLVVSNELLEPFTVGKFKFYEKTIEHNDPVATL